MRKGTATPERNNKPSLTIPCRTRSPIEAFQMLRQGQPIDIMAGYYDDKDILDKDFWMMDKVAKLHHLAELKKLESDLERSAIWQQDEIRKQQQLIYEQQQQAKDGQTAKGENPKPTGVVPESRGE